MKPLVNHWAGIHGKTDARCHLYYKVLLNSLILPRAFPVIFIQHYFAQADRFRGNLYILIAAYVFHGFFQGKFHRRGNTHFFIGARRAHVRELFGFGNINYHIVGAGVFTYHLPFVNILVRIYKKSTSILQFINGVSNSGTGFHSYKGSVALAGASILARALARASSLVPRGICVRLLFLFQYCMRFYIFT